MKHNDLRNFFTFLLLIIFSPSTFSFWILGGNTFSPTTLGKVKGVHQEITRQGAYYSISYQPNYLDYPNTCNSQGFCRFTDDVIEIIMNRNKSIDGGITADNAEYHCDKDDNGKRKKALKECSTIIHNQKEIIIEILDREIKILNGNLTNTGTILNSRIELAQEILGKSLHTLQDFYSHSNWVERQIYGYKNDNSITLTKDIIKIGGNVPLNPEVTEGGKIFKKAYKKSTEETCSSDPYSTTIFLNELTSGYYADRPHINQPVICTGESARIYGCESGLLFPIPSKNGQYFDKDAQEKCQHGIKYNGIKGKSYYGIAKDSPFVDHHDVAVSTAIIATGEYINSIIDAVKEDAGTGAYTDYVILKFLGHDVPEPQPEPEEEFHAVDDSYTIQPNSIKTFDIVANDVLAGHVYDFSTLTFLHLSGGTTINNHDGTLTYNSGEYANIDTTLIYNIQDTNGEYTAATVFIDVENNEDNEPYDDHKDLDPFESVPVLSDEELAEGKKLDQVLFSNSYSGDNSEVIDGKFPRLEEDTLLTFRSFDTQDGQRILTRLQLDAHSDVDANMTLADNYNISILGREYHFNYKFIRFNFHGKIPFGEFTLNYADGEVQQDIMWSTKKTHSLDLQSGNLRATQSTENINALVNSHLLTTVDTHSQVLIIPIYTHSTGQVFTPAERKDYTLNASWTNHFRASYIYIDNEAPIAEDDIYNLGVETPPEFNVLGNDNDPDKYSQIDKMTVIVESTPTNGTATISTATAGSTVGKIIYTPNPGFSGVDSFTYSVADNYGLRSNTATVKINIDNQIIEGDDNDNDLLPVSGTSTSTLIYYYSYGGNDTIQASGESNNVIDGGLGDDILRGGGYSNNNTFVFQKDPNSTDIIKDFPPNNRTGKGLIDLSHVSFLGLTFSSLMISQEGTTTVINLGDGQTIRLELHVIEDLNADDFIF